MALTLSSEGEEKLIFILGQIWKYAVHLHLGRYKVTAHSKADISGVNQPNPTQPTPWSRVLEKPTVSQISTFYGTWRFFTVLMRAHHWSLFSPRWIQSTPSHFPMIHSNNILPSTPMSSEWSLSFRFYDEYCMHFPSLPCVLIHLKLRTCSP